MKKERPTREFRKKYEGEFLVRYSTCIRWQKTITPDQLESVAGRRWGSSSVGYFIDGDV